MPFGTPQRLGGSSSGTTTHVERFTGRDGTEWDTPMVRRQRGGLSRGQLSLLTQGGREEGTG